MIKTVLTATAATLLLGAPAPAAAQIQQSPGHYHDGELGAKYLLIEQALKCDCGCGLDVHSCQFQMQCGTSPVWSERIRRELEAGRDIDAIKAGFVADFGGTVLMAPPAEGFNLVGYLLPSFAIVFAGMLVGLLVRRGARVDEGLEPVTELDEADRARLQAALRRLDKEEQPDW
ncbi:MAG: cytochrome c-type biogenesis protein CcmH [Longimicrobiales bacterium]